VWFDQEEPLEDGWLDIGLAATIANCQAFVLCASDEFFDRAEAGLTDAVAYFEWSADPSADPGAVETWRSAIPALGHTITVQSVAADFSAMTDVDEFRRSHLNLWMESLRSNVFPPGAWLACAGAVSTSGPPCFALDVNPERTATSIAAASAGPDGKVVVELVDRRRRYRAGGRSHGRTPRHPQAPPHCC
jgi:hypothetical protein